MSILMYFWLGVDNTQIHLQRFRLREGLSHVIGPWFGRPRPVATLGQHCPQMTQRRGRYYLTSNNSGPWARGQEQGQIMNLTSFSKSWGAAGLVLSREAERYTRSLLGPARRSNGQQQCNGYGIRVNMYRAEKKFLYMVWWILFQLFLKCSAQPCLGPA